MEDTEKEALQKAFDNFITELKKADQEAKSDSNFESLIENMIVSRLQEEELPQSGFTILEIINIASELSKSTTERTGESISSSLSKIHSNGIRWFLDHIYTMSHTIETLRLFARGITVDKSALSDRARQLQEDRDKLQGWLNDEIYERIQGYEHDIKKLQEEK